MGKQPVDSQLTNRWAGCGKPVDELVITSWTSLCIDGANRGMSLWEIGNASVWKFDRRAFRRIANAEPVNLFKTTERPPDPPDTVIDSAAQKAQQLQ
jgi:hypothetical protein